ncbi:MAG TPA: hypothetical protein VFA70_08435, partial [Dehalococcoidia bacterium]|nr:hypothetical protein [Dehalococcoidia bacterium]
MSGVRLPRGADCGRAIALLVRVVSGLRVRLDVRTVNAVEAAIAEYEPRAAAGDPIAQAQLHRLRRARRRTAGAGGERPPSRWAHVPLAALFEAHGNALRERRDG